MTKAPNQPDFQRPSRVLPSPTDFPIQWLDPSDADLLWSLDLVHYPGQMVTMDGEFATNYMNIGFNHGAERYHLPERFRAVIYNTYFYRALIPQPHSPSELAAIEERRTAALSDILDRLPDFWEGEILPEIRSHLAFWEAFDLTGATAAEFALHFAETERRLVRVMHVHMAIALPIGAAASIFTATYRELFPDDDAFAGLKLLQGLDNITLRSDRGVWRLSQLAASSPSLRQLFESTPSAEVIPALREFPEGEQFLAALMDYLNEYGKRFEVWGLSRPSMLENPAPVIDTIKNYMRQPELDLEAMLARAGDERERKLAEVRRRLQGYPGPVREQFERSLKAAQVAAVILEDHNYWIDFRPPYEARRVILEAGRRLVASGALVAVDDVFHLTFAEVAEALAGSSDSVPQRQATIAGRKAELERFASVQPPSAFGMRPPDAMDATAPGQTVTDPAVAEPHPAGRLSEIRGIPGSPGVVRGTVRIVERLTSAGKLLPGDILVTMTTAPAWTPLFAIAAGIVTDAGGPLTHCAVVAREYGLPAVIGTGSATSLLQDGQLVELDGSTGVVRVIAAE